MKTRGCKTICLLTAKTLFYRLGRDRESFWTATLAPPHQPQNPKLHQTSVKWIQFQTENVGSAAWSGIEFSLSWVSVHVQGGFSVNIWWKETWSNEHLELQKDQFGNLNDSTLCIITEGKEWESRMSPFWTRPLHTIILWGMQTTHPAWYNLWF